MNSLSWEGWKAPPTQLPCSCEQLTWFCPGLGKHALSSLQWDFGPKSMSYFLSFTNRFSSESCIVLALFWAIINHKRNALSQRFTNVYSRV